MGDEESSKGPLIRSSQRASSCDDFSLLRKKCDFTRDDPSPYKSTEELPASVAECFQNASFLGKLQNSLLHFIGRGNRYKIIPTRNCAILSMIAPKKQENTHSLNKGTIDPKDEPPTIPLKEPLKQAHSLPVRPKISTPKELRTESQKNDAKLADEKGNKYSYLGRADLFSSREDNTLLRQYMSLQQLAIARRHCNQLRRIRDSLLGKANPRTKTIPPSKEQEKLRNFLMDVGFVQYYNLLNRHGYDFETASHMDVLDLAAVGVTEPLHRMALKYELDQIRRPIKPLDTIPETVKEWLDSISLSEYTEHFEQNGIFCPLGAVGLTKRDLQLMGIYMLGHRKKLVLALSALTMGLRCRKYDDS